MDSNPSSYFSAKNSLRYNWVQIDFGGVVEVWFILIWIWLPVHFFEKILTPLQNIQRVDLLKRMTYESFNRMKSIEVRIGNHINWKYVLSTLRLNVICNGRLPPKPNHLPLISFNCDPSLGGRYMSIQNMESLTLELAEIDVYKSGTHIYSQVGLRRQKELKFQRHSPEILTFGIHFWIYDCLWHFILTFFQILESMRRLHLWKVPTALLQQITSGVDWHSLWKITNSGLCLIQEANGLALRFPKMIRWWCHICASDTLKVSKAMEVSTHSFQFHFWSL